MAHIRNDRSISSAFAKRMELSIETVHSVHSAVRAVDCAVNAGIATIGRPRFVAPSCMASSNAIDRKCSRSSSDMGRYRVALEGNRSPKNWSYDTGGSRSARAKSKHIGRAGLFLTIGYA